MSVTFQSIYEARNLRRIIQCPICIEILKDPVSLACGHSFCKECIAKSMLLKQSCPLCQASVSSPPTDESFCVPVIDQIRKLLEIIDPDIHVHVPGNDPVKINDKKMNNATEMCIEPIENTPITNKFSVGDVVNVLPRTWPGMNKPGGAAWIKKIEDDGTYSVKYVLTGTMDFNIHHTFLAPFEDLEKSQRRHRSSPHQDPPSSSTAHSTPKKRRRESKESKDTPESLKIYSKGNSGAKSGAKLKLLGSSLLPDDMAIMEQFCLMFRGEKVFIANQFDVSVTHLIVPVDNQGVLHQRTMKYLQAMITGKWIVSCEWMKKSVKAGKILSELDYEVAKNSKAIVLGAPRKAREAHASKKSALFAGIDICLFGSFPNPGPPKSDVSYLLVTGDANIVPDIDELMILKPRSDAGVKIILCAEPSAAEEAKAKLNSKAVKSSIDCIHIVNAMWALDCITNYRVENPQNASYQCF